MRMSLHLIIPRFCDKSFSLFFFGSLNCTENGGKTTSYYYCSLFSFSRKTTFDDDDVFHRHHRYADTTNTNETLSSSVRTRES